MITKAAKRMANQPLQPENIGMKISDIGKTHVAPENIGMRIPSKPKTPKLSPENIGMRLSDINKTHVSPENLGMRLSDVKPRKAGKTLASLLGNRLKHLRLAGAL